MSRITFMEHKIKIATFLDKNGPEMSVKETIKLARGSFTQTQFAELLDTRQSLISKYESGNTNPPAHIIDKCMRIIHGKNVKEGVSIKALEIRMRNVLSGPEHADARKAFAVILDSLT